jgi:hypothetical protein
MSETVPLSIEVKSLIGRALMLQILSAIMIIGSLVVFVGGISVSFEWLLVMSVLYVIGFVQLLITRYVMQKEEGSITAAIVVTLSAIAFSIIVGFFWIIQSMYIGLGLYFIIVGMVNAILAVLLLESRKTL